MNNSYLMDIILESVATKVSSQVYNAYFRDLKIVSNDSARLIIGCKNLFIKQVIKNRYFEVLAGIVRSVLGNDSLELELTVEPKQESNLSEVIKQENAQNLFQTSVNNQKFDPLQKKIKESQLNPKYTFESFIVGSGNQLAHAAALAVVNNPGTSYNPLFIYGGVGLGKTHLMQAIGNSLLKNDINYKILYCTTENFLNEMIQSIMKKNTQKFREKYRELDVLILDDIQFISNKEALQEEFFNTFNALYQSGKQIIIASDRPPADISHLESRIKSRFEGGLVVDIQAPNLETRIAILKQKVEEKSERLPENVLYKIAEYINSNIRELEGALSKVLIYKSTKNGVIREEEVLKALGYKITHISKRKITPNEIIRAVAEEMQIDIRDIKSSKRHSDVNHARQICMYLLKNVLHLQLTKIAKHVSRKDHATIIHGISRIENMLENDEYTIKIINSVKSKLQII